MMRSQIQVFVLAACLAIAMIGCSKDPVNPDNPDPNRLTLDGDSYVNQKFVYPQAVASYLTVQNLTAIAVGDSSSADGIQEPAAIIFFEGSAPGTYTIGALDSTVAIWVIVDSTTMYALESGTLTVSQYGPVGGKIIGTFSGSGIRDEDGTPITVTITDGAFTAARIGDNELNSDELDPTSGPFSFKIDGPGFSNLQVDMDNGDVVVDSVFVPSVAGAFREVKANGIAKIGGDTWIITVTLAPMQGEWRAGTFDWTANSSLDFYSAKISMIPVNNIDVSMTFYCDGSAGSTIVYSVEDKLVTGEFQGQTIEIGTNQPYVISNGRFTFALP